MKFEFRCLIITGGGDDDGDGNVGDDTATTNGDDDDDDDGDDDNDDDNDNEADASEFDTSAIDSTNIGRVPYRSNISRSSTLINLSSFL
jgi:hypothetical protein